MPGPIQLVVTDLDGTLWDSTQTVHPRTLAAITELERRGIPLLVATARRAGGARRLLRRNGLELPAVFLDGALVSDRAGATIHADWFDQPLAATVLATFTRYGVEPCLGVLTEDGVDARLGPQPSTHPEHVSFIADWTRRADLTEVVATETVQSFVICGVARSLLDPVADALAPIAAVHVTLDDLFDGYTITVRPPDVNKWRGVRAFCDHQAIDSSAVLAIGDGLNDVELLEAATVACVIEGSDERVTAHADHIVGRPDIGGWADVLDHLAS